MGETCRSKIIGTLTAISFGGLNKVYRYDPNKNSGLTTCVKVRDKIETAINLGTSVLYPKSGVTQTISKVNNMIHNYEGVYGLTLKTRMRSRSSRKSVGDVCYVPGEARLK